MVYRSSFPTTSPEEIVRSSLSGCPYPSSPKQLGTHLRDQDHVTVDGTYGFQSCALQMELCMSV